jgi:ATP-dependent RNA helicase DOB1
MFPSPRINDFYTDLWTSKMTEIYEGSLIRLFRRLEELLRQMAQAGKVMGSDELAAKFEESLVKIRRDIVAAQSLYL